MMTHQLRREVAWKIFFKKKSFPHDAYPKMISASWGIILSHIWCGQDPRPPPPPTSPVSPLRVTVSPSGVPVTGAQKGGGPGKGLERTPPPRGSQFSPAPDFQLLPAEHKLKPPARVQEMASPPQKTSIAVGKAP